MKTYYLAIDIGASSGRHILAIGSITNSSKRMAMYAGIWITSGKGSSKG